MGGQGRYLDNIFIELSGSRGVLNMCVFPLMTLHVSMIYKNQWLIIFCIMTNVFIKRLIIKHLLKIYYKKMK